MILMSDIAGGDDNDDHDGMIILHVFLKWGSVLSVQNGCLYSWEKAQNTEKVRRSEAIQSN